MESPTEKVVFFKSLALSPTATASSTVTSGTTAPVFGQITQTKDTRQLQGKEPEKLPAATDEKPVQEVTEVNFYW